LPATAATPASSPVSGGAESEASTASTAASPAASGGAGAAFSLAALIVKCPAFDLNTNYSSAKARAEAIKAAFGEGKITKADIDGFIKSLEGDGSKGMLIAQLRSIK
jgi:hypothetical protein